MESFAKLMSTIGALSVEQDLVAILPIEISEIIFRQLDPRSLLNVARVSKKWMNVCKSDCKLRRTARHHLRKERRQLLDVESAAQRLTKNPMTIPARANLPENSPINPAAFSFKPSSGVLPGGSTRPKRNGHPRSEVVPKRIMTRLR